MLKISYKGSILLLIYFKAFYYFRGHDLRKSYPVYGYGTVRKNFGGGPRLARLARFQYIIQAKYGKKRNAVGL